jgi:hypothetical protein
LVINCSDCRSIAESFFHRLARLETFTKIKKDLTVTALFLMKVVMKVTTKISGQKYFNQMYLWQILSHSTVGIK